MQGHAAYELHIIMALTQRAARRFADSGKCFFQHIVQRLAICQTRL